MRIVIQRVKSASCTVDNQITGSIEQGFMVLVGFCEDDNEATVSKMAAKLKKLRIFEDENGRMNLGLKDINGSILSISQFTLYADCKSGNRPSFSKAMKADKAIVLYNYFNKLLEDEFNVAKGIFGSDMKISLLNDGPVTIIMDSKELL